MDVQKNEPKIASAEDYFSDDTSGRNERDYVQRSGLVATTGFVRARHRGLASNAKALTESELNAQLERLNIPSPSDPQDMNSVIRDGVFQHVTELLKQYGQGEWALRPRTFCILHMLSSTYLMDRFIASGRTDASLPYNKRNLPDFLKGEIRERFLRRQGLVLSAHHLAELESDGGAHFNFHTEDMIDKHFTVVKTLGQGRWGLVEKVYGTLSLKVFARKRIHRGESALQDQTNLTKFEKELRALKAAAHEHLVKLVSSYSDPTYVGLIMWPVADGDLKSFLASSVDTPVDRSARQQCLRTFFGCLITALEYLHNNRIIHKDIKPANVLVRKEKVYLTDFGTARTLGDASKSMSSGRHDDFTDRYCAPEVADSLPHGRPSDIWSMGCVFLEMATVLHNRTVKEMEDYYRQHGMQLLSTWKNPTAFRGWIEELRKDKEDMAPMDWAEDMVQEVQGDRPEASQVWAKISDSQGEHRYFCFQCRDQGVKKPTKMNVCLDLMSNAVVSYLQRHVKKENKVEEDTVTAKMLEEEGGGDIPQEHRSAKEANINSQEEVPQNEAAQAPAEVKSIDGSCASSVSSSPPVVSPGVDTSHDVLGNGRGDEGHSHEKVLKDQVEEKRSIPKKVSFDVPATADSNQPLRFQGIQQDRRPTPSVSVRDNDYEDESPIEPPEPLRPPSLDLEDCYPLPSPTLVPSYLLASANRFSFDEINAADSKWGLTNLFVYGRLMFPSVLRGFAHQSMQGVYDQKHQRRLVPSSLDWSGVNVSVKRAAEAMTPARLEGFDIWRPSHMECAAIQETRWTDQIIDNRQDRGLESLAEDPPGTVMGFLIVGLGQEALRYCDLVFLSGKKSLRNAQVDPSPYDPVGALMERKTVIVDVQLTSKSVRSIVADTYIWAHGADHLRHAWKPEHFIRSSSFQKLSQVVGDGSAWSQDWREEELSLARTMQISYALAGDELCSAIVADDFQELQDLLELGYDPDAACRRYGTPLQAAVAYDRVDMVNLLLHFGANPNSKGGKFGTPLIAAAIGSRKAIMKILLKHRANVFASDRQHVNALYQAVGQGDYAVTQLLLDAGAWLSGDYGEIADLAIERRDREVQNLLLEYDVRGEHAESEIVHHGSQRREVGFVKSSSRILAAVANKALVLAGKSGKWRGRKGVEVTRAALRAGAPPMILDYLRDALNPIQMLYDILRAADNEQERIRAEAHVEEIDQRFEDLGTDDESENEDDLGRDKNFAATMEKEKSDTHMKRRHTVEVEESDYEYITGESPTFTPPEEDAQSVQQVHQKLHFSERQRRPYHRQGHPSSNLQGLNQETDLNGGAVDEGIGQRSVYFSAPSYSSSQDTPSLRLITPDLRMNVAEKNENRPRGSLKERPAFEQSDYPSYETQHSPRITLSAPQIPVDRAWWTQESPLPGSFSTRGIGNQYPLTIRTNPQLLSPPSPIRRASSVDTAQHRELRRDDSVARLGIESPHMRRSNSDRGGVYRGQYSHQKSESSKSQNGGFTNHRRCERCGGLGWYVGIIRGVRREMTCDRCWGRGWIDVYARGP